MREDLQQEVKYRVDLVNARGDVFGESEERKGVFIGFTPDYETVVIRTEYGEIVHVNYKKVTFTK
jgi:hypothetical protein